MPISFDTATATSQLPPSAKTQATPAASGSDSNSMGNVKNLSNTFLQLLTQELQNQDPTAPMDSTQMVGQMISLNQLEQLSSINQTLQSSASPATPAATGKAVDNNGQTAQASSAIAAQAAMQAASFGNTLGNTSSLLQNAGISGN